MEANLTQALRDKTEVDITVIGRRTGREHSTPVWFVPEGGSVFLLPVGGRSLRAVHTPGHTRGHLVFADLAGGLLFAGDHVLPHITPSIGFEAAPAESPLADYLRSLAAVRAMPDLRLLPAHGPVTESVHARVDELLTHHEDLLAASQAAVEAGAATPYEAARALGWTRRNRSFADLDVGNRMLAVCETAAHLLVLEAQGRLRRSTVDGVEHFTA